MLYFVLRDQEDCLRAFLKAQMTIFGVGIPFLGLAGTLHETVCKEVGLTFIPEVFVDIDYTPGGVLLGVPQSNKPTLDVIRSKVERMLSKRESEWNHETRADIGSLRY